MYTCAPYALRIKTSKPCLKEACKVDHNNDQDNKDGAAGTGVSSEPKVSEGQLDGANALVSTNPEDTDETGGITASPDASDVTKPCQPIPAKKRLGNATLKQRKFAAEYANRAKGNGTLAARLAGYKGNANQLAVQASANLRNPKVQHLLADMVDSMTQRALQRLGDALDATSSRAFLDKQGAVVYTEPVPDHRMRLQAAKFVLDLRDKYGEADVPDGGEVGQGGVDPAPAVSGVDGNDIDDADRALFEEAATIEDQLAELDAADDADDHEPNE